jgi:hypothetical protein
LSSSAASAAFAASTSSPSSSINVRRSPPFSQKRWSSRSFRSRIVENGAITISGGENRRGCPASITRRRVVPLRGAPTTKQMGKAGSGEPPT